MHKTVQNLFHKSVFTWLHSGSLVSLVCVKLRWNCIWSPWPVATWWAPPICQPMAKLPPTSCSTMARALSCPSSWCGARRSSWSPFGFPFRHRSSRWMSWKRAWRRRPLLRSGHLGHKKGHAKSLVSAAFGCFEGGNSWRWAIHMDFTHVSHSCSVIAGLNHSWLFQTQPQVSFSNVPTYVAGTDAFGAPASTMQMYIIKNGSLTWLGQQVRLTGNPCEMKCLWDIFRGREFDIYCLVTQHMIHTYHRYHRYHRCQIYIYIYICI